MDIVLSAFAVFFVYSVLTSYLTLPSWAWTICQTLLSAGAWGLLGCPKLIYVPAIAGMATLIKGTEALLLVTRDRVTVELLRSQRR